MEIFNLIMACFLIICAVISLYYLLSSFLKKRELKKQEKLLEEQREDLEKNLEYLGQLHRIQHDAKNHYLTIRALLESGKEEEAKLYLTHISEWIGNVRRQQELK